MFDRLWTGAYSVRLYAVRSSQPGCLLLLHRSPFCVPGPAPFLVALNACFGVMTVGSYSLIFAMRAKTFTSSRKFRLLLLETLSVPMATLIPIPIIFGRTDAAGQFEIADRIGSHCHAFVLQYSKSSRYTIRSEQPRRCVKESAVKILYRRYTVMARFALFMFQLGFRHVYVHDQTMFSRERRQSSDRFLVGRILCVNAGVYNDSSVCITVVQAYRVSGSLMEGSSSKTPAGVCYRS